MGYKVFTAGEEALASDVNSLLMSQTVARFTTAAQRTSQLSAPVLNQLSVLDTRPGLVDYWNGSAWVALPLVAERSAFLNPNVVVAGAGADFTLGSFTMPWAGVILASGMFRADPGAGATAALINALVDASATSVPVWATPVQWVGPQQPANTYFSTVPFAYKTGVVAAGTACTVKVRIGSNSGAMGFLVTTIQASLRLVPGEF